MTGRCWEVFRDKYAGRIDDFFKDTNCVHLDKEFVQFGNKVHGRLTDNAIGENPVYLVGCDLLNQDLYPLVTVVHIGPVRFHKSSKPATDICGPNCPRYQNKK